MEPIFERLAEKFHFSSPEDILDRFETLERTQMEIYTELLDVRETRNQTERELNSLKELRNNEIQTQYVENNRVVQKAEKQIAQLQDELLQKEKIIEKNQSMVEKYLQTSSSLLNLWNKWSTVSSSLLVHLL